jgi:hypothetical protein
MNLLNRLMCGYDRLRTFTAVMAERPMPDQEVLDIAAYP